MKKIKLKSEKIKELKKEIEIKENKEENSNAIESSEEGEEKSKKEEDVLGDEILQPKIKTRSEGLFEISGKNLLIGCVILMGVTVGTVVLMGGEGKIEGENMEIGEGEVVDNVLKSKGDGHLTEEEILKAEITEEGEIIPSEEVEEEKEEEKVEEEKVEEENKVEEKEENKVEEEEGGYEEYRNTMAGIGIKYPRGWYVNEKTEVVMEMLKGGVDLKEKGVNISGVFVTFEKRDEVGSKIAVGVSPLKVTGDVDVLEVTSLTEVITVGTLGQINNEIRKNIESQGGEILELGYSALNTIGNYECIQSSYKYKTNGITMSVVQLIVPYGANNIVLVYSQKDKESNMTDYSTISKILEGMVEGLVEF